MPATVRIVIDGAQMDALLDSPEGPIAEWLIGRASAFQAAARMDAPVRTGCLRASIVKRVEVSDAGPMIRVVSDTAPCSPSRKSYSLYVHDGARPHNIPNAFGYGPDFGVGGRFSGMFHPGNRPNPFFRRNLPLFGAE